jgi:hypothetical protein
MSAAMTHVSDPPDAGHSEVDTVHGGAPGASLTDEGSRTGVETAAGGADPNGWIDTGAGDRAGSDRLRRLGRRVVRRPLDWVDAPWTVQRTLRTVTTFLFLLITGVIVLNVVHWNLVTTDNTPTGGDMGSHVMGPAYLRDHLLDNFKLSGWNPYWYDGFPMYRFYMVIPALMIVFLNIVLPYGIAFKIVAVLGVLTLPICCWAFGRLARFAFPVPELFALGALVFLLEDTKDLAILGGTVKSTMAGEFSFSIALSFAMLGLGLYARGLETGKHRGKTAVILALAVLSHGIVAIFVLIAATLMALIWMDKARFKYTLTTLLPMGLLTSFWIIPFATGSAYMTDMKYEARPNSATDSYWKMFFNLDVTLDRIVFVLALIGFIAAILRRHLTGAWMGITIVALGVLCRFTQTEHKNIPLIGLLWNPRVLPFINLLRYLLMMAGIVEVGRAVAWVVGRARVGYEVARERREGRTGAAVALPTSLSRTVGGVVTAFSTLVIVLLMLAVTFEVDFFGSTRVNGRYALGIGSDDGSQLVVYHKRSTGTRGLADSWAKYNFTGYEDKGAYGEYRDVVETMAAIGADPQYGCGRALWENNERNGQYGTTMALMLLPHWTDGCIGSSEGLFFEASGTTPYHFLAAAALSAKSSNPVRELRYTDNDAALGVRYLQDLGIRYYMAWTDQAVAQAATNASLVEIRRAGPWHIYEVADSDIVTPLTVQPVVVEGRQDDREKWLELGTSWYQNPSDWPAVPAGDGPAAWQRVDAVVDPSRVQDRKVDVVVPSETIQSVPLEPVQVSNVTMGNETVDFDVDTIGVPVVVKVSYFPNWTVDGADGPYRIAPNLMVVIPTAEHVSMSFERSTTDYLAYVLSLIGLILIFVFRRFVPIRFPSSNPFVPTTDVAVSPASPSPVGAASPDAHPDLVWRDVDAVTPPAGTPVTAPDIGHEGPSTVSEEWTRTPR